MPGKSIGTRSHFSLARIREAVERIGRPSFPYGNMCRGAQAHSSTHGRMETPGASCSTPTPGNHREIPSAAARHSVPGRVRSDTLTAIMEGQSNAFGLSRTVARARSCTNLSSSIPARLDSEPFWDSCGVHRPKRRRSGRFRCSTGPRVGFPARARELREGVTSRSSCRRRTRARFDRPLGMAGGRSRD
jgi:hypothetical protein